MEHLYCKWTYRHRPGAASFTYFSDQSLLWKASLGESIADRWPEDMTLPMDPERPEDVALIDFVNARESLRVVSPALRTFLEEKELPNLEWLPITLLDHKGRVASRDYSVMQCCHVIDCIDQDKSDFKWDKVGDPTMLVRTAIFDATKLGPEDLVFRAKYVPATYFVREDLAREIMAQGFKGPSFKREFFGDFNFKIR